MRGWGAGPAPHVFHRGRKRGRATRALRVGSRPDNFRRMVKLRACAVCHAGHLIRTSLCARPCPPFQQQGCGKLPPLRDVTTSFHRGRRSDSASIPFGHSRSPHAYCSHAQRGPPLYSTKPAFVFVDWSKGFLVIIPPKTATLGIVAGLKFVRSAIRAEKIFHFLCVLSSVSSF